MSTIEEEFPPEKEFDLCDQLTDAYTRLRARAVAMEKALEWRPIDEAPLDGHHVMLYRPEIEFIGYYGGANSGWRHNAPGLEAIWPLPTHFRPLPPAP